MCSSQPPVTLCDGCDRRYPNLIYISEFSETIDIVYNNPVTGVSRFFRSEDVSPGVYHYCFCRVIKAGWTVDISTREELITVLVKVPLCCNRQVLIQIVTDEEDGLYEEKIGRKLSELEDEADYHWPYNLFIRKFFLEGSYQEVCEDRMYSYKK